MNLKGLFFIPLAFVFCSLSASFAQEECINPKEQGRLITITQGIDMTLKNNHLIRIALPGDEMYYQDSLISRSALLPSINLTATKQYFRYQPAAKIGSTVANTANKDPFSFGADVYQTLFDFGKSLSNFRASKESYNAQKSHTESVRRVATLEFIVAYFNYLEAQELITVSEKEVESLSSYLDDIQHLYEQGVVVNNDLLPAKVKLADAKQRLITSTNAKEVEGARLNNILALSLREKILAQDIVMQPPQFPDLDDAWKTAQDLRPEVTFYADQIKSSVLAQKAKAVANLPEIFAQGDYSYDQNNYQQHESNAYVALGAKMDLYDGGASRAQLLKERAKQRQLSEEKNKLIDDIRFEIEDSFYSLKNACEKVVVAKDALQQADENVRFYRVKYNAGVATTTDVLEAITLQTKAQTNYCSADYELKRNYAKLMYSMGMDLKMIYEKMESEKNGPSK